MADAEHSGLRRSFRMLAHEAVVCALLGFLFALTADFVLDSRHSNPAPKISVGRVMFAPDGIVRMVPEAEVQDAYQAGAVDAIQVKDTKGAARYVKPEQVDEVLAAGGSLIEESPDPFERFGGRPYLGRGDLDWMLSAPGFHALSPADQRAALLKLTGDKAFASLSDADTTDLVSRFQKQNKHSIVAPNGETGLIPAERLQEAFAAGYREADIFDVLSPEESADRNFTANRKASTERENWRENALAVIRPFALHFVIGALVGFPSGLLVWGFYRMVRFAITG